MRLTSACTIVLVTAFTIRAASGDTLEMRDGTLLNGKYDGGTAGTVRITTAAGTRVVEISQIVALTFAGTEASTQPTPAAVAPAAASAPPPAAQVATPVAVTVPAGTVLTIRL